MRPATIAAALFSLPIGGARAQSEKGPISHPQAVASDPVRGSQRGPVSHPTADKGPASDPTTAESEKSPVSHPSAVAKHK